MRKMFKKLRYKISLIINLWKEVHEMPAVYIAMRKAHSFRGGMDSMCRILWENINKTIKIENVLKVVAVK